MNRTTIIEDSGYSTRTSWPLVPDMKEAIECHKNARKLALAVVPAVAAIYFFLTFTGVAVINSMVVAAIALIAAVVTIVHLNKKANSLRINTKMVKLVAELAGTEVDFTSKALFDAFRRNSIYEQIVKLTDEHGLYVNSGGKNDVPYVIFIAKNKKAVEPEAELVEEQAA